MKIGLIGKGFVGNSVYQYLGKIPYYCKEGGDFAEVDKQDYIFMCLPTPFSGKGFDLSIIEENIQKLSPGKKIIIKSTILPGTTEMLATKYPQHKFFFNPEFLVEKTALANFLHPDKQIVGYVSEEDKDEAQKILDILPKAVYGKTCIARLAEMVKIVANDFLALKVVFANQIYDYCQDKNVDYDIMVEMLKQDKRLGDSHWQIFFDGYRGYDGHCFPKDMKATVADSGLPLLAIADLINESLKK
jgi:UDPglucose 6-dehydrogenase